MSYRVLRLKRRYIAARCVSDEPVEMGLVYGEVERMFVRLFGEVMLVQSRLRRIRVKRFENTALIIACGHAYLGKAIAALTLVNSVDNHPVALDVITVSGTLRNLKRKLLQQLG